MRTDKQSTWNVVSESIRREYGFSDRTEKQIRDFRWFQNNCLGSLFIVKRMQFSHFVKESALTNLCMNFKNDRNLICRSHRNRWIYVYDWKDDILKSSFKTKHSDQIYDVKFLNTGGNGMDIISACLGGQVHHTCIAPAGNLVWKRIFLNSNQRHRLITVPRNPLEFIAASSNGGIFLIDLRSENWSPSPDTIVFSENKWFWNIEDIAHHPLAPEICVCGRDAFVRVFDKRNLKEAVKKIHTNSRMSNEVVINHCSYNYDGTEILANYAEEGAYLFDNRNFKDGEFLHFYAQCTGYFPAYQMKFFGPKSEYIIRGTHGRKIFIQKKNSDSILKSVSESSDLENTIPFRMMLEIHPHLPVVASIAINDHISIWAPTRLKFNTTEDYMVL